MSKVMNSDSKTAMRACVAVSGLAVGLATAGASAQGVTLYFSVSDTAPSFSDTLTWTVSAQFTGYPSPTAYFGGFAGSFHATDSSLGTVGNFQNLLSGEGTTPVADGADVDHVNIFNAALLGTDDPTNPIDIFTFDFNFSAVGSLSYDAAGVVTVFADDGIFTLGDEYTDFDVVSDHVWFPAPGSAVAMGLGGLLVGRRRRS